MPSPYKIFLLIEKLFVILLISSVDRQKFLTKLVSIGDNRWSRPIFCNEPFKRVVMSYLIPQHGSPLRNDP